MSCRDTLFLHKSPLVFLNPLAAKHSEVQMGSLSPAPENNPAYARNGPLCVACRALPRVSGPLSASREVRAQQPLVASGFFVFACGPSGQGPNSGLAGQKPGS
jgi:hypothetical protein